MALLLDGKLLTGLLMIAMNLGTRHVVSELTPMQDRAMGSLVARRFVLFAIFYVAVRDVLCALSLTCLFTLCVGTLFNERSRFCLFAGPTATSPTNP
jgi:hypothetical protein